MMHFRFLIAWYDKVLGWSKHPKGSFYLGLVSFIDASLFPVSPLFMFLPMSFAEPKRAFQYASIAIVASILGGMLGYALGLFAFELVVNPFMNFMGYQRYYQLATEWVGAWGFWAIVVGCVTPIIPYKIFTIGAGIMQLHFGGFLLASILGRSTRFLVIGALIRWGGPKIEPFLRRTLVKISNYQRG